MNEKSSHQAYCNLEIPVSASTRVIRPLSNRSSSIPSAKHAKQ